MRSGSRRLALAAFVIGVAPQPAVTGQTLDLTSLDDPARLEQQLRRLLRSHGGELRLNVPGGHARLGSYAVGRNQTHPGHLLVLRGDADLFGHVTGNVVSLDGDIVLHQGAVVSGDALAIAGRVRDLGGLVQGETRALGAAPAAAPRSALATVGAGVAGLIGVFITLTLIGFGVVLFGKPNLETISDTVSHSFLRSLAVGLLAQVLVIPTFGMLVVGLILSVVGVLLIPFVVPVYLLLVIVGLLGGFLGVAHAMGEVHTRRRMAAGTAVSPNSYRYVLTGLVGLLLLWLGWALFGWVPIAGGIIWTAAVLATWLLGTVGFGACLLSRAGVQPGFAGRYVPPEALTDEYLWATPKFGVTAVKRPEKPARRERDQ